MKNEYLNLAIRVLRWSSEDDATDKADFAAMELKQLQEKAADNAALRERVSELEAALKEARADAVFMANVWKQIQEDETDMDTDAAGAGGSFGPCRHGSRRARGDGSWRAPAHRS